MYKYECPWFQCTYLTLLINKRMFKKCHTIPLMTFSYILCWCLYEFYLLTAAPGNALCLRLFCLQADCNKMCSRDTWQNFPEAAAVCLLTQNQRHKTGIKHGSCQIKCNWGYVLILHTNPAVLPKQTLNTSSDTLNRTQQPGSERVKKQGYCYYLFYSSLIVSS